MLKSTLLGTSVLLLVASGAIAADLPSRRAPPVYAPAIPVFSWTGFYIGGQVGYAFGRDSVVTTVPALGTVTASGSGVNGIIGGAHVGYNFSTQGLPLFGSALGSGGVFGIEGDVDGDDYRRSSAAFGLNAGSTISVRQGIQGSIRGRLGFAVDRALFYATGGAAFADFHTALFNPAGGIFPGGLDSYSRTRVGYTVGGGIEYAITNNWSLRAEYRYSDFGKFTDAEVNSTATIFGPGTTTNAHRETQQRVQAGFSYKFDTLVSQPVVARY